MNNLEQRKKAFDTALASIKEDIRKMEVCLQLQKLALIADLKKNQHCWDVYVANVTLVDGLGPWSSEQVDS